MKRIYGLIMVLLLSINLIAQSLQGCSAEFSIMQQSPNTFLFEPIDEGDPNHTQHFWEFGNVNINSISPTPTYTFLNAGVYSIRHYKRCYDMINLWWYTDTVTKSLTVISNEPQPILTTSENYIRAYPNPTYNVSNIPLKLNQNGLIRVYIYNNQQTLIAQTSQSGIVGQNQVVINLGNRPSGIYYIMIVCGRETYNTKIRKI